MGPASTKGTWVIVTSFLVALILTILPLPEWAIHWRPEWVMMVLIYWCLATPHRVGVGVGWLMGLILDIAQGSILGQHALALTLVALATLHLYQRIRVFPLQQQAVTVLMLVAMGQMLVLWIKGFIGQSPETWSYWLPSFTSMLLWPWLFLVLRDVRRKYQIN